MFAVNRVIRLFAVLATGLVFLPAAVASAQEPGVTLDPASPSAKEYALPIDAARREASGGSASSSPSGSTLFGEGVSREKPRQLTASARSGGGSTSSDDDDRNDGSDDLAATGFDVGSGPDGSGAPETEKASAGSSTALIGGGLGVLFLAALGGLALRAMRQPD